VETGGEIARPTPATGPLAVIRIVRQRDFGLYFLGNAVSASGTWFQNLAAALLVYRLTHSAFLLGLLSFCTFLPVLVLVPWTGAAADRFDRRRLLMTMQVASTVLAATLAALAYAGHAGVWVVLPFSAGLGVLTAFATPASQALLGSLVGREDLPSAIALNSMTFNIARAAGPALAALSVRKLGIPATFAINAASYLALAVALIFVRPAARSAAARGGARFRESLRLVRDQPRLLAFLLIVTAVSFAADPVATEGPAFAHAFGRPDTDAGYFIGAFGAGAVIGALFLAGRVAGSSKRMLLTLIAMGGGIMVFSVSPSIWVGYAFLAVAGFGFLATNTASISRLQLEVSEDQRGRIMALWSVAFIGTRPLASLLDGAIAAGFGVRTAGVCLAVPALCAAGAIYFLQRPHRSLTTQA
jgi:MFS family permease